MDSELECAWRSRIERAACMPAQRPRSLDGRLRISQAMQSHYSIQQFDTKMAALEALEHPPGRPENEPTPPAQQPASAGLIQPALQAEIDRLRAEIARLAERQSDLDLQGRRRPRRKSAGGAMKEGGLYRQQPATNVIAFPTRLA
jgi:hypothetical protein